MSRMSAAISGLHSRDQEEESLYGAPAHTPDQLSITTLGASELPKTTEPTEF